MSALETFRQEVRAWLEANAPRALRGTRTGRFGGYWGGREPQETSADRLRWFEMMLSRGWTAPTWPEAYGGGGHSVAEARVLSQELAALQLPPLLLFWGVGPLRQPGGVVVRGQHQAKCTALWTVARASLRRRGFERRCEGTRHLNWLKAGVVAG